MDVAKRAAMIAAEVAFSLILGMVALDVAGLIALAAQEPAFATEKLE